MGVADRLKRIVGNYRQSQNEVTPPLKTALLYVIPPFLILLGDADRLPVLVAQVAAVLVVVVTLGSGVWLKGYHRDGFEADQFGTARAIDTFEEEVWTRPEGTGLGDETWRIEYEQISEEIRTYNRLAVRSTYFSLATLAILASVFFSLMGDTFQPFVAGFGIAISFAFTVAAEKNVLLRDVLRARQRFLEEAPALRGKLTLAHTWNRGLEFGQFPSANLGIQLVDFNKFWMYVWILTYHISTVFTAFIVIG